MVWNLEEALSYYQTQGAPKDQSALISLLREIQQNHGGSIPKEMLSRIAQAYHIKESFVLAVIRRIPSLHLRDVHCLEICSGPNCSKSADLVRCAESLHASSDRRFLLKFTPCMRMCGQGPNIKWNGIIYHKAGEALLRKLLKESGIDF